MNLSKLGNTDLLTRFENLVRSERKITHLVLLHINEVENRRLYADLGFESMFTYLTKKLGYGEDSAYRRLQAVRLIRQVPEAAEKLEEGSLTLTQLAQVQKCLRQEKKSGIRSDLQKTSTILNQLEHQSNFESQKILAKEFDLAMQARESLVPQRDESLRLEIILTPDQMDKIKQAKDLLSHSLPDGSWADLFALLAEKQIQKVLGAKAQKKTSVCSADSESESLKTKQSPTDFPRSSEMTGRFLAERFLGKPETKERRASISVHTRRELLNKAQHRCEFIDPKSKRRCASSYQLQIDHRHPWALGGTDHPENLRIYCRTHNLRAAEKHGLRPG